MKAATYLRVSTEEQAEQGTSLDTQRERTRAYIEAQGWEFVDEYADEGVSGTKDESVRDGLRDLMRSVRAREIDVVVVTKVDRFSRSVSQFSKAVEELEAHSVAFVSVSEGFDSTHLAGKLMRNILASFAEFEHGRIAERMRDGRRRVAAQGFFPGGPPPFGFRPEPVEGTKHSRLVVDEEQAETIRLAASLIADQGCSLLQTAETLNGLGRKPARAARWDNSLIRHLMTRDHVKTILGKKRFDQVQRAMERRSLKRRPRDHVYPLSLRIVGKCGERYHGVYRKELSNRYYSCKNKLWENRHQRCEDQAIRADDIEYVVWEQVCDLLARPERLVALAEEYLGLRGQQIEFERDEYEETKVKIDSLDRAIKTTLVTSAKAGLAPRDIEAAVADLAGEREALEQRLLMIESWRDDSAKASKRMRNLWKLAEEAHKRLPQMTPQEQKQVIDLLDLKVTVIEHAKKSAGGRVLAPAKVKIEGLVNEQVLVSDDSTRDIGRTSPRRS